MRQQGGPNSGRRPRGRHHSDGRSDNRNSGGGGNGNVPSGMPASASGGNRPRSASALRHQTFDSNCVDMRVRGNAWQVFEKYQALARDAQSSGDRVTAENYLQHAEHYFRIIEAINEATALEQRARPQFDPQQQPPVPANYYGSGAQPNSTPEGAPTSLQPNIQGSGMQGQGMQGNGEQPSSQPEAEVTKKSFFTQQEIAEDHDGNQQPAPFVAQR